MNADFTLAFVVEGDNPDKPYKIYNPQDPEVISRPPYNPYLYVHNTGHDVHLIDEEPLADSINKEDEFGNPETFRDADGFPWGLLVPPGPSEEDGWVPPLETQRIEVPYPRFTRWRESGGELSPDWYLHSEPWEPEPAVYAAGYYEHPDTGFDVACYWEDGVKTDLTDGTTSARANEVYVYDGDVYVAGYYNNGDRNVAAYWKNGTKEKDFTVPAPNTEDSGEAQAIWVDDTGVYVSGYYRTGTSETTWYWDGTTEHELENSNSNAEANGIAVQNGSVYVSGYYHNGAQSTAVFWTDGTRSADLYDAGASLGLDLFVTDAGEVYVSGSYNDGSGFDSGYWDAGGTLVPMDMSEFSLANAIFVSGGTVYTTGSYGSGVSEKACYWTGSVKTDLDNGRGRDICLENGVMYIAGYYNDGEKKLACYWKDGVRTDLYDSGAADVDAEAASIFVVPGE